MTADLPVRLLDDGEAPPPGSDERMVGTAGEGLWRRAPWPVPDDLLGEHPPQPGAGVLLVDRGGGSGLGEELEARGVPVTATARLDRDALRAASVVVFAGTPGDPLPAQAAWALAAGRVLVIPHASPNFGLLPAVDHLSYGDEIAAAQYADVAFTHPAAFESMRAMGRIAARAHLASTVHARWAVDIELGLC